MAEKKKKKGFLSKLGFKSKADKLAEEAAAKAEAQQLVDEKMAQRMAAINAAALASARKQDEAAQGLTPEETAAREAEEKRLAEIQAARDVARAKQLAEERARKEEQAKEEAARLEAEDKKRAEEAAVRAAEDARRKAEAEAKRAAEEKARLDAEAAETARIKAAEAAALADAKSQAEAEALKAKQEAEAIAREEARLAEEAKRIADEAAREAAEKEEREAQEAARIEAERIAAEAAAAERLKREAEEADRRARIAEEKASREIAEREAEVAAEAKRAADRKAAGLPEIAPEPEPLAAGGFLGRISAGLRKSTSRMSDQVGAAFTKRKLDEAAIEELEDILVMSDLGYGVASKVTDRLREDKFDKQVTDLEVKIALADVISDILTPLERPIVFGMAKPQIMLFVGVNGSGKTTTLGKMAKSYTDQNKKVLIVAGDTFRAAAVEQLTIWGERASAPVMSANQNADAAGLVYDAIQRARDEDADILMIDTAGRLQNRTELMDELSKIIRVIRKQDATAPHHSILVLDATVGQNALIQTEAFKDTADVSGLIMTKLDGTAKGGVLVALSDKYGLPIHHIGIGERIEDLENFSAPVFAAALSGVADALKSSEN
jgi:fused signal recognition particle receptor